MEGRALSLLTAILTLSLASATKYSLKLGTSCAFSHHCESGCCDMGFDPSDSTSNVLGFYCFTKDYCQPGSLKHPGQSCRVGTECLSTCCEDTVCQASSLCFGKYILPFVIVFGILAVFAVVALCIVMIHKCKKARNKKSDINQTEVLAN